MPIRDLKDAKGHYFQYGKTGHKYYYKPNSKRSRTIAYNKCVKQAQAIKISEGSGQCGSGFDYPLYLKKQGKGLREALQMAKDPAVEASFQQFKNDPAVKDAFQRGLKSMIGSFGSFLFGHGKMPKRKGGRMIFY